MSARPVGLTQPPACSCPRTGAHLPELPAACPSYLAAFGHGEAPSQEKDDVPGHRVLSPLPRQQGHCLCVGSWAERRHSAWEGIPSSTHPPTPGREGTRRTLRTLSQRRGHMGVSRKPQSGFSIQFGSFREKSHKHHDRTFAVLRIFWDCAVHTQNILSVPIFTLIYGREGPLCN